MLAGRRIAHVVRQFWPSVGGLEEHVDQLTQEQARSERVYIITLDRVFGRPGKLRRVERRNGVTIIRVPFIGFRRLFLPFLSLRLLKRFDVVHVHALDQCTDVVGLLTFMGLPRFAFTSHGLFFHTRSLSWLKTLYFYFISRITLSRARTVLAVSENDRSQLAKIGVSARLVRNPVACHDWMYRGGADFLYVGRIAENKCVEKLIPFIAALRTLGCRHKLHIVGGGDERIRRRLQAAIEAYDVKECVHLHGRLSREDLRPVIARCGFAVSASRYEGYGMAVVEGMSAGLLPVVHPNRAFQEICEDSGCGLLVDFDRPVDAAETFLRWQGTIGDDGRIKAREYAQCASFAELSKVIAGCYPPVRRPIRSPAAAGRVSPAPAVRRILGVDIRVTCKRDLLALLLDRLRLRSNTSVGFANANFLMQACSSRSRIRALRDMLIVNDGIGTDIASMLLYGERFRDNLNGTDLVPDLLSALPKGTRVFLYGAHRDVVARAATVIESRYPVTVCGYLEGHSRGREADVVDFINALKADVVLVALGNPRQEDWILRHQNEIGAPLILGVGALLDFLTGAVPRAPHWVRRLRFEWAFRLLREPLRLRRRYTSDLVRFLALVLAQRFGLYHAS